MNHDDDAGEDLLAGIDLHKWRVPPPLPNQRPEILIRALAPPVPTRRRLPWAIAGVVISSAAIAAIVAFVISRPVSETRTTVLPAGTVDADIRELLVRIEQQQREIERRVVELQELRELADRLAERVRHLEQRDDEPRDLRERPVPKRRDPGPTPGCDEVSCVLNNYEGACCTKFKRPSVGYLTLQSNPPARVFIDGVDTGKTTPIKKIALAPGRHQVTFIVDGESHRKVVVIEAKQTAVLVQDFTAPE